MLHLQTMFNRRSQHAGHHFAVGRTDFEQPDLVEQPPTRRLLQFAPQPVALFQQGHIVQVLEIRLANDASLAVAAAAVVRRMEAVDSHGPHAPPSKFAKCGTPHAASPEHNYIVDLHGRRARFSERVSCGKCVIGR